MSSDLTAATDLLPHDLVQAIVETIIESCNLPPWAASELRRLTGPQDLVWPALGNDTRASTKRGILMGLPTSWPILCLVHLYWIHQACGDTPLRPKLSLRSALCGDDNLSHWPEFVVKRYHQNISDCGGKLSKGKHFVSKTFGCFCEKLFKISFTGRRERTVQWKSCSPADGR